MEEKTEIKAISTDASTEEKMVCPCCGQLMSKKPFEVDDSLMDQWLACMITGNAFTHTYSFYEGKLKLTLSNICSTCKKILTSIDNSCSYLKARKWSVVFENIERLEYIRNLVRNSINLLTIEVETSKIQQTFYIQKALKEWTSDLETICESLKKGTLEDQEAVNKIEALYHETQDPARLSTVPLNVIYSAINVHLKLLDDLEHRGFDSNFWEGIKHI